MFTENETIAKYEIMDGAPVKGESIPIRVFLAGYDLTPTMREINKKFSVRYFLNLVLMDTEDRRYFKQQEITLWRKPDKTRKSISSGAGGSAISNANQNAQMPSHLVEPAHSTQKTILPDGTVAPLPSAAANCDPLTPSTNVAGDQTMGLFTEDTDAEPNQNNQAVRSNNPLLFEEDEQDVTSSAQSSKLEPQKQEPSPANDNSSLFDSPADAGTPVSSNNKAELVESENTEDSAIGKEEIVQPAN